MPFLSKTSWNFTIFQNYVEAKPQEPLLWNFAWINGRLFAFRQKKSRYPNVITLGTIKVLLVPVAFENRVAFLECKYMHKANNSHGSIIKATCILIENRGCKKADFGHIRSFWPEIWHLWPVKHSFGVDIP